MSSGVASQEARLASPSCSKIKTNTKNSLSQGKKISRTLQISQNTTYKSKVAFHQQNRSIIMLDIGKKKFLSPQAHSDTQRLPLSSPTHRVLLGDPPDNCNGYFCRIVCVCVTVSWRSYALVAAFMSSTTHELT